MISRKRSRKFLAGNCEDEKTTGGDQAGGASVGIQSHQKGQAHAGQGDRDQQIGQRSLWLGK
ncbi:MAG: hypothetical protein O6909_14865 [Alphaproteobacteria bacterium]|nr:hypothetical protein [Alphaproteobacteria bacterium]